ncbi:hypothetical protein ACHAXS_014295 [Conticribra weissflogii]
MPPPPPPSASYNLVIDTSSEDEEDEEECDPSEVNPYHYYEYQKMMQAAVEPFHRAEAYCLSPSDRGAEGDDIPLAAAVPLFNDSGYSQDVILDAASVEPISIGDRDLRENSKTNGIHSKRALVSSTQDSGEEEDVEMEDEEAEVDYDGEEDEDNELEMAGENDREEAGDGGAKKKKKKKKKKPKKKKKKKSNNAVAASDSATGVDNNANQIIDANVAARAAAATLSHIAEQSKLLFPGDASAADGATENMVSSARSEHDTATSATNTESNSNNVTSRKNDGKPKKSISFGTISVREYARTLGTHTVPADGGWPLGLSERLVEEHHHLGDTASNDGTAVNKSAAASSPNSPSKHKHHHQHHQHHQHNGNQSHPHGWTIDDFEHRKQHELKERYIQMIIDLRKRKFEKEWERKHLGKHFHAGSRNSGTSGTSSSGSGGGKGGRSRSNSIGGGSGNGSGGRKRSNSTVGNGGKRSGSFKMDMSPEERQTLEELLSRPVIIPEGTVFETRPYDYKKKGVGVDRNSMTEEDELYNRYGGRNPLFMALKEDDRKKVLLRDDHYYSKCHVIDEGKEGQKHNPHGKPKYTNSPTDREVHPTDPHPDLTDPSAIQHIQHELETLRIQRSDPINLGCSCRKLHVFLPGATDKSHHKKKGSNRRLPERKVREELRRRGLLQDENGNPINGSREDMERRLHDAIEKEPCCWGKDCPCVRSGIGCQADTCSCWHPGHDVEHSKPAGTAGKNEKEDGGSRRVVDESVEKIERQCGNPHGMYVVNFGEIRRHREKFVNAVGTN